MTLPASSLEARILSFSGRTWEVRTWGGGPGNGCWSPGEASVRVDEAGALHLRVANLGGVWCQAEVNGREIAQYGDHLFYIVNRIDKLDPHVVLGLFLYSRDHEIDVELTGSFGAGVNRGWYSVHGGGGKTITESFDIALTGTFTTHRIGWYPDRIEFESWHGHCASAPCGGILRQWIYRGPLVPPAGATLVPIMNFWINRSGTPASDQEVTINRYEYRPPAPRHRGARSR